MKYFKIILGLSFIATVIYAYFGEFNFMYELTCISNLSAGVILMLDGIFECLNKKFYQGLYLYVVIPILFVYTSVFMVAFNLVNFSFKGGFMLLHAVTPLVFLIMYLFTTKQHYSFENKRNMWISILTYPLGFIAYLLFDLIRFLIIGDFVYGILDYDLVYFVPVVGIVLYLLAVLLAFCLIKLKMYVDKKLF